MNKYFERQLKEIGDYTKLSEDIIDKLDVRVVELSEKDVDMLNIMQGIIDNDYTIRQAALEYDKRKSTVHAYLRNRLSKVSIEMYDVLTNKMKKHKSGKYLATNILGRRRIAWKI